MGQVEKEISSLRKRMEEKVEAFKEELARFNLGQASTSIVENLRVSYWGEKVLLNSLANVVIKDVLNLIIEPFDPNSKEDIILALKEANLNCSIIEEGGRIRLNFPPLSEERKEEIIKLLHQKKEDYKIALRQEREETKSKILELEKNKIIGKDEKFKAEELLNDLISEFNQKLEEIVRAKENDLKR